MDIFDEIKSTGYIDIKKIHAIQDKIDKKFVQKLYGLDRDWWYNMAKLFEIFHKKNLLELDDIYTIYSRLDLLRTFIKFRTDFTLEHMIFLVENLDDYHVSDIIASIFETRKVLEKELINLCCRKNVCIDFFIELEETKKNSLSKKNINDIFLNTGFLWNRIKITQENVLEFFRRRMLRRYRHKLKKVKIDVKCFENACLLSQNLETLKILIKDHKIDPNIKCLENACSIDNSLAMVRFLVLNCNLKPNSTCLENACTLAENSRTVKFLTEFDIEVTQQCLLNIILCTKLGPTGKHVRGLMNRPKKESEPEPEPEIEGVENI